MNLCNELNWLFMLWTLNHPPFTAINIFSFVFLRQSWLLGILQCWCYWQELEAEKACQFSCASSSLLRASNCGWRQSFKACQLPKAVTGHNLLTAPKGHPSLLFVCRTRAWIVSHNMVRSMTPLHHLSSHPKDWEKAMASYLNMQAWLLLNKSSFNLLEGLSAPHVLNSQDIPPAVRPGESLCIRSG